MSVDLNGVLAAAAGQGRADPAALVPLHVFFRSRQMTRRSGSARRVRLLIAPQDKLGE